MLMGPLGARSGIEVTGIGLGLWAVPGLETMASAMPKSAMAAGRTRRRSEFTISPVDG